MKKTFTSLIVITPYTKRFGVAVFSGTELSYFGVKTLPTPRTLDSIRGATTRHLKNLIIEFSPTVVVIKTLTGSQMNSEKHRHLAETVKQVSESAGIPAQDRSFEIIKQKLAQSKYPTMEEAFTKLRKVYPELSKVGEFQNRSQREYYAPLLTAVAIGFAFQSGEPYLNS